MPQTRECDYCGADIEPGTGTMFVRTNGTTIHFCSSKCEKNADLGREARDLSWTETGRESTAESEGSEGSQTADEPAEPARSEDEPVDAAATEGDVVEDTGAAPDLEDDEVDDTPGPEGEGATEAAADGETTDDTDDLENSAERDV